MNYNLERTELYYERNLKIIEEIEEETKTSLRIAEEIEYFTLQLQD